MVAFRLPAGRRLGQMDCAFRSVVVSLLGWYFVMMLRFVRGLLTFQNPITWLSTSPVQSLQTPRSVAATGLPELQVNFGSFLLSGSVAVYLALAALV
jgi:hypothetical protein